MSNFFPKIIKAVSVPDSLKDVLGERGVSGMAEKGPVPPGDPLQPGESSWGAVRRPLALLKQCKSSPRCPRARANCKGQRDVQDQHGTLSPSPSPSALSSPQTVIFCFGAFSFLICLLEKWSGLILKDPFPSWTAHHEENKSIYFTQALWCSHWLRSCRNPVKSNILSAHKGRANQRSRGTGAGTASS